MAGLKKPLTFVGARIAAAAFGVPALIGERAADAFPTYLDAFIARYPTCTTPQRLENTVGACSNCHSPLSYGLEATAYRLAVRDRLRQGMTIQQALAAVEPLDSDGDGVRNIDEILRPRPQVAGQPQDIGYHPGLVGTRGVDPLVSLTDPVTGMPESPLPRCPGDTNADNRIDFADLNNLLGVFGLVRPGLAADVNRDDRVDFRDLNAVLGAFGAVCP